MVLTAAKGVLHQSLLAQQQPGRRLHWGAERPLGLPPVEMCVSQGPTSREMTQAGKTTEWRKTMWGGQGTHPGLLAPLGCRDEGRHHCPTLEGENL